MFPFELFGTSLGSANLLENGNYLVSTHGGNIQPRIRGFFEVSPQKEIVYSSFIDHNNAAFYRAFKIPSLYPNAFNVISNRYIYDNDMNEGIEMLGDSISFSITNHSGYSHNYK